jgi:hypothetical protein
MRKVILLISLYIISVTFSYAQLGGLINKAKDKASSSSDKKDQSGLNLPYSESFFERYSKYFGGAVESNQSADYWLQRLVKIDMDSAKAGIAYFNSNKKKYASEPNKFLYPELLIEKMGLFDTKLESNVLPSINNFIEKKDRINLLDDYAKATKYMDIVNSAKHIYAGKTNLNDLTTKLEIIKTDCTIGLVKSGKIACIDQLNWSGKFRFSTLSSETTCLRGKDKLEIDVTDNGVYVYYFGDIQLNAIKILIDGKETNLSMSISNELGENFKPENGWNKFQFLPGLKESTSRNVSRLEMLVKNYGLTKNSEISFKSANDDNFNFKFTYLLSKYNGDVNSFLKDVKTNQLKTVKLPETKYTNAAVEKEVLEAYKKFTTDNPQHSIGVVKKVMVEGNNWQIKKTSLGLIDHQQSNAYFIVKGVDGACYIDWRQIRKVYDQKTKTYGPIKVVGGVDKKEISCDLVK